MCVILDFEKITHKIPKQNRRLYKNSLQLIFLVAALRILTHKTLIDAVLGEESTMNTAQKAQATITDVVFTGALLFTHEDAGVDGVAATKYTMTRATYGGPLEVSCVVTNEDAGHYAQELVYSEVFTHLSSQIAALEAKSLEESGQFTA